mgnify:CR=1 FL=1
MICERCGKEYEEDYRKDVGIRKKSPSRFCSRNCSNARDRPKKVREKISKSIRTSEKARVANKNRRGVSTGTRSPREIRNCLACGAEFETTARRDRKYCNGKCWNTLSGGYKEGSVKNHVHGKYKGFYYDSSWELVWMKWAFANEVIFERNGEGFEYYFQGKKHKYHPDFYLPEEDRYVEVKGIQDEIWEAKKNAFPYKLEVVGSAEIKILKEYIEKHRAD